MLADRVGSIGRSAPVLYAKNYSAKISDNALTLDDALWKFLGITATNPASIEPDLVFNGPKEVPLVQFMRPWEVFSGPPLS